MTSTLEKLWHWTETLLQAVYLTRVTAVHFIYCFSVLMEWQLKHAPPGAPAKPSHSRTCETEHQRVMEAGLH